jgi:transposase
MYRVHLDENQRQQLRQRTRRRPLAPATRDRLEMVRLCNAGWSIPTIARHLQVHDQTVRRWIKAFLSDGLDGLEDKPRPGKPSGIGPEIREQVRQWLEPAERVWSAPEIAAAVEEQFGVRRSAAHWRRLLRRERQSYKRTRRTLEHKQKPLEVASKRADLLTLEKGAMRV